MKQRGRKPSASLTVIEGDFGGKRPEPPPDLTPRAAELWRAIVEDEPLDCFATAMTREMLKDLCIQRAMADNLTQTINEIPSTFKKNTKGLDHLKKLLKARDTELRGAASLATKLRLTNQARYTPRAAASASANTLKGIKPWDWEK